MIHPELRYYDFGEGVTAFSSTRRGGYSEGNYGEFNINRYCGDKPESIAQNREALCDLLGISDDCLLMPHQVHLTEVVAIDEAFLKLSTDEQQQRLEGVDALMTNVSNVCIGVSTADCIPVLLFDAEHHAVCAIHAGWRGTVQRIVEVAVDKMTKVYHSNPQKMVAQIGPGMRPLRKLGSICLPLAIAKKNGTLTCLCAIGYNSKALVSLASISPLHPTAPSGNQILGFPLGD